MTVSVAYLPDEAIEQDTERLLREFGRARGIKISPPIPLEDIVEKHLKITVEFDNLHEILDVPRLSAEPDILGALWVDGPRVVIHETLDPEQHPHLEGRYRFTLAHEVGHFRLHQAYLVGEGSAFSEPGFICRQSQASDRLELQADRYASCLLIPRILIRRAWKREFGTEFPVVYELMKHMPIARQPRYPLRPMRAIVGDITSDPDQLYLFNKAATVFAPMFGVINSGDALPAGEAWASSQRPSAMSAGVMTVVWILLEDTVQC